MAGTNTNVPINRELLVELRQDYDTWNDIQSKYNELTGEDRSNGSLRKTYSRIKRAEADVQSIEVDEPVLISDRYVELSTNQSITEAELLQLHGYDPNAFTITSSGSSRARADRQPKDGKTYSIRTSNRINVKPIPYKITENNVSELLNTCNIKPIMIDTIIQADDEGLLLALPLFDLHFGNMVYEEYIPHQQGIANRIVKDNWKEVVFFIGQDLLHNDNFRGQTSSGTFIEKANMSRAWDDAHRFYQPLIKLALRFSEKVKVIYTRGNHDEALAWAFVKSLGIKFPQVEFDCKQEELKHHVFGNVFLGSTHGDKINDKKVVRVFEAKYRLPMAIANRRVIFKGHFHTLKAFDDNGTHVNVVSTPNRADQWHQDNGFIGNHKAMELFVFNKHTQLEHLFIES